MSDLDDAVNALIDIQIDSLEQSISGRFSDIEARLDALEGETEPPPPSGDVTIGPGFACSGVSGADKQNRRITTGGVAIRFVARRGGTTAYARFQFTNRNSSYGRGDGGKYLVSLTRVDAQGKPTGNHLGAQTFEPGIVTSPSNFGVEVSLTASLIAGQTYALVIENVHANPESNYSSYNSPYHPSGKTQPGWNGEDVMFLTGTSAYGTAFVYDETPTSLPAWDIEYTDGRHEGISAIRGEGDPYRGVVGPGSVCKHTHAYSGPSVSLDTVKWWMTKVSGSDEASCAVRVNGALVASSVFTPLTGTGWASASFEPITVADGDTLEVSVASQSTYHLPVILWQDYSASSTPPMESFPYEGGPNPFRALSDGAPVWSAWHEHTSYMVCLTG